MDTSEEALNSIVNKTLDRINSLKESNLQLTAALEAANGKLASYQGHVEKLSTLEAENVRLVAQLEASRKQFVTLKWIVTQALTGITGDATDFSQKVDTIRKAVSLVELLYEADDSGSQGQAEQYIQAAGHFDGLDSVETPSAHPQPASPAPMWQHPEPVHEERTVSDLKPADVDGQISSLMAGLGSDPSPLAPDGIEEREPAISGNNGFHSAPPQPAWQPQATEPVESPELQPAQSAPSVEAPRLGEMPAYASQVDLIVAPFARFETINKFIAAVRGIPGVVDAKARHFQKGTLRLTVEYDGVVPLASRLSDLSSFSLAVSNTTGNRIEATLESTEVNRSGVSNAR